MVVYFAQKKLQPYPNGCNFVTFSYNNSNKRLHFVTAEGLIIIQDAVISFIERVKTANRIQKLVAYGVTVILLMVISFIASGVRITYNITVDGNTVATVAKTSVFKQGVKTANDLVGEIGEVEIKPVITVNATTADAEQLSRLILENAASVINGFVVKVGDERVAYVSDKAAAEAEINARLSSFNIEGAECVSEFVKKVSVNQAYFSKSDLTDTETLKANLAKADVVTTARKTTKYTVPFDTITKKTSSKLAGYVKVTTSGVKGTNQKVEELTLYNGEIINQNQLSDEVLVYPVNEVVVIGTGKASYTSAVQNASAQGFRWPLAVKGTITSYWGDGRNHQGIDVGVPTGTSILAVKGGTVVEAGYKSDYGYYVILDHGNGVKTRYAHNKANIVSAGDRVSAGQVIALSGNTGRSTGPHLHFEVIINGQRVNPAPYLGI